MFTTQKEVTVAAPTPKISQGAISAVNPDDLQKGEAYTHYGKRVCGLVAGNTDFLHIFLQRVYNSERQKQANNEIYQQQAKQDIRSQISTKEAQISQLNNNKTATDDKIKNCSDKVSEYNSQIDELKTIAGQGKNKEAKIKEILGIVVLVPLTVYLFMFYISTIYSAFFRDFTDGNIGLGTAMFDPQAIPSAWISGMGEFLFVITAPVIFLGLGFALHFFAIQDGKGKYFKMAAVICVTFAFDCILAFLIGKHLHEIYEMTQDVPATPYTINTAISDPNIWAVIFCGFIVYIIWGVVFDMTMTAYNDFCSNKSAIKMTKVKIDNEEKRIASFKTDKTKIQNDIIQLEKELAGLQQDLASSTVHYSLQQIKDSLSQFFAGWSAAMATQNPTDAPLANNIYTKTLIDFDLNS